MSDIQRADRVYSELLTRQGEQWVQPRVERTRRVLELMNDLTIPAVIISHDPDDVDTFAGGLVLYDRGGARTVPDYADLRKDFATAGKCLRHLQEQAWA